MAILLTWYSILVSAAELTLLTHCYFGPPHLRRYMGMYFTRGSFTYAAPVMVADPTQGMTMAHVGTLASAFPLAYGFSKQVLCGVHLCEAECIRWPVWVHSTSD